jgi:hypothetical protein
MIQLLFILLLIPLGAGGLLLLFSGVSQQRTARWIALAGSLASLAISLVLLGDFRNQPPSVVNYRRRCARAGRVDSRIPLWPRWHQHCDDRADRAADGRVRAQLLGINPRT